MPIPAFPLDGGVPSFEGKMKMLKERAAAQNNGLIAQSTGVDALAECMLHQSKRSQMCHKADGDSAGSRPAGRKGYTIPPTPALEAAFIGADKVPQGRVKERTWEEEGEGQQRGGK